MVPQRGQAEPNFILYQLGRRGWSEANKQGSSSHNWAIGLTPTQILITGSDVLYHWANYILPYWSANPTRFIVGLNMYHLTFTLLSCTLLLAILVDLEIMPNEPREQTRAVCWHILGLGGKDLNLCLGVWEIQLFYYYILHQFGQLTNDWNHTHLFLLCSIIIRFHTHQGNHKWLSSCPPIPIQIVVLWLLEG